jgi:hypothetical protein
MGSPAANSSQLREVTGGSLSEIARGNNLR